MRRQVQPPQRSRHIPGPIPGASCRSHHVGAVLQEVANHLRVETRGSHMESGRAPTGGRVPTPLLPNNHGVAANGRGVELAATVQLWAAGQLGLAGRQQGSLTDGGLPARLRKYLPSSLESTIDVNTLDLNLQTQEDKTRRRPSVSSVPPYSPGASSSERAHTL